jgi:hypothetical protein
MDHDFLKSFDLNVGDAIDRGEADPGEDALFAMLYASPYDGKKQRYLHVGEACLGRRGTHWLVDFAGNAQGFEKFLLAMKKFSLHDHQFWRDAFRSAANVWQKPELAKAADYHVFFFIDPENTQVIFFENPAVALLFDTLEKTARLLAGGGDIKIELAE